MIAPNDILDFYFYHNFRVVFWAPNGDSKGPREEGWTTRLYQRGDYVAGMRVGLLCGHELAPGKFLHDTDIDWGPGAPIAQALLPPTDFMFGRASKKLSHCFYTLPDALPTFRYEDIDGTCLIEIRGTKLDGTPGMQTMVPPSVWSKDNVKEPLQFVKMHLPSHLEQSSAYKQRVCSAAIAMILAKNLGKGGFTHDLRLAWAGFILRTGMTLDECLAMGNAIMLYTGNADKNDIRLAIESTHKRLAAKDKKVKGGPSLAKLLGSNGKAIVKKINGWLGRDSDFIRNAKGIIVRDSQENVERALTMLNVDLSYNEFTDKLLVNHERPLEDQQLNDLWFKIDSEFRFRPPREFFDMKVKHIGWSNNFHPVRDYLDNLHWDGVPRIDEWLITSAQARAKSMAYVRAISAIVLIAAVRRIRQPGCKYDEMLILVSEQGKQKSSALRTLCPNPDWFSDDFELGMSAQRTIECTAGKWIIEASELSGMRPAQRDALKSNLSRQVDGPARMAYARLPIERARQFILIGTTNSHAILEDPTGSRRFWPVRVERFNLEWIAQHRDQLWAEAAARERAGESNRLAEELWPDAGNEQDQYSGHDPWEAIIRHQIMRDESFHRYRDEKTRVTTSALWNFVGVSPDKRTRRDEHRVSEIMQRLGFARTRVRPPGENPQIGFVSTEPRWLALAIEQDDDASVEDLNASTGLVGFDEEL